MKNNEQHLIDIMFSVCMTVRNHPSFKVMKDEQVAEWIRRQLKYRGYNTKPIGDSWGVLVSDEE